MSQDFIFEYFCRPIIDPGVQGYNLVNTATYALILFAVVFFWLYPFLKKRGLEFGFRFAIALLPFVFFGSAFRVLNDIGVFSKTCNILDPGFFTFTPGIWFLTAGIAVAALIIAKKTSSTDEGFYRHFAGIGLVFALPALIYEFTIFRAWDGFAIVLAMLAVITGLVVIGMNAWKKGFFKNKLNVLVVSGQVLDGSATFVATNLFNCGEQHPLIKIALALLIIHYADKEIEDKNTASFVKLAVVILGFATGTRDLLTLGAGTCL